MLGETVFDSDKDTSWVGVTDFDTDASSVRLWTLRDKDGVDEGDGEMLSVLDSDSSGVALAVEEEVTVDDVDWDGEEEKSSVDDVLKDTCCV